MKTAMPQKFFFRADASRSIGAGHVMRMIALAEQARAHGHDAFFIMRDYPGGLCGFVERQGFSVRRLPGHEGPWDEAEDAELSGEIIRKEGGAGWVAFDRIGASGRWEAAARSFARRILSVDDQGEAARDCDILINQNILPGMDKIYNGLVPPSCSVLTGPGYALLRGEFTEARLRARPRDGRVGRILVSFGGGPHEEVAARAAEAVAGLEGGAIALDVITGFSPESTGMPNRASVLTAPANIPEITMRADLVIGAYGVSTFERMLLGAPNIIITVSDVQEKPAAALAREGLAVHMGKSADVSEEDITGLLEKLMADSALINEISRKGMETVDGFGAGRVFEKMKND